MKAKNNFFPYFYLVLGCLGIIAVLAISIPAMYRHYRNAEVLSKAINTNVVNHDEQLAEFNRQLLESQNSRLKSLFLGTFFPVALFSWYVFRGIAMIKMLPKGTQRSDQNNIIGVK